MGGYSWPATFPILFSPGPDSPGPDSAAAAEIYVAVAAGTAAVAGTAVVVAVDAVDTWEQHHVSSDEGILAVLAAWVSSRAWSWEVMAPSYYYLAAAFQP